MNIEEFKNKIRSRWGESDEIKALLLLAGLWDRGLNDGWDGCSSLSADIEQIGVNKSTSNGNIFATILNKWIEDGLLIRIDSDRYQVVKPGLSSPKYFDIK